MASLALRAGWCGLHRVVAVIPPVEAGVHGALAGAKGRAPLLKLHSLNTVVFSITAFCSGLKIGANLPKVYIQY